MEDTPVTLLSLAFGPAGIWFGSYLQKRREREKDRQDQKLAVYAELIQVLSHVEKANFIGLAN